MAGVVLAILGVAVTVWWMWPRLAIDDSILNRPRIWLAGLGLFAANPSGVGLGNFGAVDFRAVVFLGHDEVAAADRKKLAQFSAGRKGAAEFIAEVRKALSAKP